MKTQYFERAVGTLAYTHYGGQGEPVLMLPGMGALRSEYRFLAPFLLEAGYSPVSMDLRGQGESSVPWPEYDVPSTGNDILALLEHLNAPPAHVIGTSFAAASAIWAAAEAPERIRSIVLISPFVRTEKINPLMQAAMWLMLNNPWRVSTWTMYYGSLYPSRKPADFKNYLDQLKENLKQPGRFKAVVELGNSSRQPSEERMGKIASPVLVIMGTGDRDFPDPAAEGRQVADRTGGKLELIEGAGHYPQTEMPDAVGPVILDFFRKLTTGIS